MRRPRLPALPRRTHRTRGALRSLLPAGLLLASLAPAGCASDGGDFGARYRERHPASQPALPHVGQAPQEALAVLYLDPAPGSEVEVAFLELRRTDRAPWSKATPEEALAGRGQIAAAGQRVCRHRRRVLRQELARPTWLLFEDGALKAWDLPRFSEECEVSHSYRAAQGELAVTERALRRWIDQRQEGALPDNTERLEMGISLVEAGRLEEAEAVLRTADEELREISVAQNEAEEKQDTERLLALDQREQALRERRSRLKRAIDGTLDDRRQAERDRWERGL